jgi:uncharacterized protein YkwD
MSPRAHARPIAALVVVTVLAAGLLVASPAPAATPADVRYANQVHERVNDVRAGQDRVRLQKHRCLQRFAAKQAQAMARRRQLFHQDLGRVLRACDLRQVGENVAVGPLTPRQQVQQWMDSPPHQANILRRSYRVTGVAARRAGGTWWVAQVFGRRA